MKGLTIRRARMQDLEEVLRLNTDLFKKEYREYDRSLDLSWPDTHGHTYFAKRIRRKDGFVQVAELDGKLVGYLSGGISRSALYRQPAKCAELENMLILPAFRGKGVGGKLVKDFLEWCKAEKIARVEVTASAQNIQGIAFYRKLGFKDYNVTLEQSLRTRGITGVLP